MTQSLATVKTLNASRYLQQLCKHWSHRFTVEFTPQQGTIAFGGEERVDLEATEAVLQVRLDGPEGGIVDLQRVVEDHIGRFAFREELIFEWQRVEGPDA